MRKYVYQVNSDTDNSICDEFSGKGSKQKAVRYAKDCGGDAWVRRIWCDDITGDYADEGEVVFDQSN